MGNRKGIGDFDLTDTTKVVASISEYRGTKRVDLRVWWKPDDADWVPTKKGVSVPVEKWPEMLKLILAVGDNLT